MTMEARGFLTPAEQELEVGIEQLKAAIAAVPEEQRQDLFSLHEPLDHLGTAMETENSPLFLQSLVALALAVIEVRQKHPTGPLAILPVPPYDLWLPFKADASRTSEDPSYGPYRALASSVRNSKPGDIWTTLELLGFKKGERLDPRPTSDIAKDEVNQR